MRKKKEEVLQVRGFDEIYCLALSKHGGKAYKEAEELYIEALSLCSYHVAALTQYAGLLNTLFRYNEAVHYALQAVAVEPNNPDALSILSIIYSNMKDKKKAKEYLERILDISPFRAGSLWNLGLLSIELGEHSKGWDLYRYRQLANNRASRALWGECEDLKSLNDRKGRLLVWTDQGQGDTIQFIRILKLLKETYPDIEVTLEVDIPLLCILVDFPYADYVIAKQSHFPWKTKEEHICLTTLYHELGNYFGETPYLKATPTQFPFKAFKVGINWKGNPGFPQDDIRSIHDTEILRPISEIENIAFFNLQHKEKLPEFFTKGIYFDSKSWAMTRDLIAGLDLVVTTCTCVCHLAGALNIPTILLLSYNSDYRWGIDKEGKFEGTSTPWYPNHTIVRQSTINDWTYPIQEAVRIIEENRHEYPPKPT